MRWPYVVIDACVEDLLHKQPGSAVRPGRAGPPGRPTCRQRREVKMNRHCFRLCSLLLPHFRLVTAGQQDTFNP